MAERFEYLLYATKWEQESLKLGLRDVRGSRSDLSPENKEKHRLNGRATKNQRNVLKKHY